ncbi:MAG: peptidyl-prolyl cis-trans isomerase [Hyphococcus sp.]|nr:MAG: peptidyl-prolyl cis-trans isomerase [Marinicaulis sp.]
MNTISKVLLAAAAFNFFAIACSKQEGATDEASSNEQESVVEVAENSETETSTTPSPAEVIEASTAEDWRLLDPENLLYIELERGTVIVALSTDLAQAHVEQMKALAREAFYDGLSFYRVIDGFVAQGGDAMETREIKTAAKSLTAEFDEPLRDDISFTELQDQDGYASSVGFLSSLPVGADLKEGRIWHLHCTGAMAMARGNEKDTGGTEIYFPIQPQRYLDRNLTVFGRVVQGMEHLQMLRRVAPPASEDDDMGETIISMKVGADIPEADREALEILRSDTDTFTAYVEARRNRPEEFFYFRPDHIDVCALNIPVRAVGEGE